MRNRRLARLAIAGSVLALLGGGGVYAARHLGRSSGAQTQPRVDEPLGVERDLAQAPEGASAVALAHTLPSDQVASSPAPRAAGRYERAFGRALSFGDALYRAGLTRAEADEVIAALTGVLDFRRARAEDLLVIERGAAAQLDRFEYRAAPTVRYEATRDEHGDLKGRQVELPVQLVRVARGGVVEGALGDALEGLALGRTLTGVFAEVFAGKVDFSTDTRRGDTFRVLLEEEHVEGSLLRYANVFALEYQGSKAGTLRAFWHQSSQTEGDFFDEQGRALHGGWLRTPVRYDHVSSGFGVRFHPVLKRKKMHNGIDYAASPGTPVRAAAEGLVRFAGPRGANGNLIALVHAHGYETFYAHVARFAPGIKSGARVKQRQVIAYVGSTGRSTGPHLHFALKRGGRFVDPDTQLNGPGLPLPARELPEYRARVQELLGVLAGIPLEQPAPVTAKAALPAPDFDEEEL